MPKGSSVPRDPLGPSGLTSARICQALAYSDTATTDRSLTTRHERYRHHSLPRQGADGSPSCLSWKSFGVARKLDGVAGSHGHRARLAPSSVINLRSSCACRASLSVRTSGVQEISAATAKKSAPTIPRAHHCPKTCDTMRRFVSWTLPGISFPCPDSCGVQTHALADWRLKPAP